ncbi:MAG TPA: Gfo/Idh/MocA family oxidoreductase [Candidatus Hydrogenedentes bacterium]|nr:Gfo/Idh/MocA family oxidoreductase [Candidatus Hydrogenedentota bacterium]HOL78301.1 Gfo/Idh/MocA family oxidoreductase [Candidatus Hydrogenedentota bacterium]HPO85984.1 Gfo/Idh/MocA family oxidoreductase [Candidatus Hydrogenedentota bacterium]
MAEQLRVGIIGCGKIAHVDHAPGYNTIPGVKIVALMDILPKKIRSLQKAHAPDAEGYTDLEKFLASGLDAVSVCTPNYLHCSQTVAALKAGLHVLCEKPMAATPADATKMIETARKMGKVLQINHTLHYIPIFRRAAEIVQAGTIGTPIHVRCVRSGGSTPDKGWSPGAKWFVTKACAGGIILDIGVHMAEIMQTIAGKIAEIAAYTDIRTKTIDVVDNATALMRFENGATGVLELSWTTPVGAMLMEVYGTRGTMRLFFNKENPLEVLLPGKQKTKVLYPKLKKLPHSQLCFINAIRGKAPSPTPGELGREAVALCDAIARSGATRRFVPVQKFEEA